MSIYSVTKRFEKFLRARVPAVIAWPVMWCVEIWVLGMCALLMSPDRFKKFIAEMESDPEG